MIYIPVTSDSDNQTTNIDDVLRALNDATDMLHDKGVLVKKIAKILDDNNIEYEA